MILLIFLFEVMVLVSIVLIKVKVVVIFSEVKKKGVVCGRLILISIFIFDVLRVFSMFLSLGLVLVRLVVILMMMGKKYIVKVVRMVGIGFVLNYSMKIGIMVILGIEEKLISSGQVVLQVMCDVLIRMLIIMLIIIFSVKLIIVVYSVCRICGYSIGICCIIMVKIWLGCGMIRFEMFRLRYSNFYVRKNLMIRVVVYVW